MTLLSSTLVKQENGSRWRSKLTAKNLELYVENSFDEFEAFFHGEALTVRSQLHGWKVLPHRHKALCQIFVITTGGCRVQLDDRNTIVTAPCALFIPENVVHGFDWDVGSKGHVLSVVSPVVKQIAQNVDSLGFIDDALIGRLDGKYIHDVVYLCQKLEEEARSVFACSGAMTIALLQQLLIILGRVEPSTSQPVIKPSRSEHKVRFYEMLIKKYGCEQHQVKWYANKIGVSSAHLNVICRQYSQSSASELIYRYLLDEAKRLLIFSNINISTVAERLGFQDQAHFTKFFKKATHYTPSSFRKNHK